MGQLSSKGPESLLEQCAHWHTKNLTPQEKRKVRDIKEWTKDAKEIAKSLQGKTICDILEMSDEEAALSVLSEKIPSAR